MPEVDIIRRESFVVDHTEIEEQYGKMTITDKEGKTYTVNKKHEALHPVFADGMAVEVGYGSYMDKDFIHTARQVKDAIPPPVEMKEVEVTEEKVATPAKTEPKMTKDEQITEMVRIKELGECYRLGILEELPSEKQDYLDFLSGGKVITWQKKWVDLLSPLSPETRDKIFQSIKKKLEA